ncbi:MAG: hypothetical protein LBQ15_03095 [Clostridium sp.]|nr:hypothetical protein [Clostridium sp.]
MIIEIPVSQGVACFYSAFINAAKCFNSAIDEEYVFLKSEGMRMTTNINDISSLQDISISHRLNEIVSSFLDSYGIENHYIDFNDYMNLQTFIYEEIGKGNPVILKVSSRSLKHDTTYHTNKDRSHTLVINGIDSEQKNLSFIDYFIPTFPAKSYAGEMSFNDLKNAAFTQDSPYRVFIFDYMGIKQNDWTYTADALRDDLEKNIEIFIACKSNMHLVIDVLKNILEKFTTKDINENLKELAFNIAYSGIIPCRAILKNLCEKHNWKDCYNELDGIIKEWYSVSLLLVKYSFLPSEVKFIKIAERIEILANREENIMKLMLEESKSLKI